MKKLNIVGLILFSFLIILLIYQFFSFNSNLQLVAHRLELSQNELDSVSTKLNNAEQELKIFKQKIFTTKLRNEELKKEKDSLHEFYLAKIHKYEGFLEEIEKRKVVLRSKIEELRREDELFK